MPRVSIGHIVTCLALSLSASCMVAQKLDFESTGAPLKPGPADAQITEALRAVSSDQIHKNIQTLVDFGTRNSLSSMVTDLPAGKGINPAVEWIKAQFEFYSKDCGGCLEVKTDTFMQEPPKVGFNGGASRITTPTKMTTIYAVLKGTDPAQAKRIYLVTGHYDTRATDVMDPRVDAPGANDDTSGTAVSLE